MAAKIDQFAEVLQESDWYTLGIFLGVKTHELDNISHNYRLVSKIRCLIEVYKCLELKGEIPSWRFISSSLKRMGSVHIAQVIDSTYVRDSSTEASASNTGQLKPSPSSLDYTPTTAVHTLQPSTAGDTNHLNRIEFLQNPSSPSQHTTTVLVPPNVMKEFLGLTLKFTALHVKAMNAFTNSNVQMSDVQYIIKNHLDLEPLADSEATFAKVLGQLEQSCTIFDAYILMFLVKTLVSENQNLQKEISDFQESVDEFKLSAKMSDLVSLITASSPMDDTTAAGNGSTPAAGNAKEKEVHLKLREFWKKLTMKQFERAMAELLSTLYDYMYRISVSKGCIFITWALAMNPAKAIDFIPKHSLEFAKIIGIISLQIGNNVIYNVEGEGCETIEAAMLQAVELRNTRAIELLLAIGCSPEAVVYNGNTAVVDIINVQPSANGEERATGDKGTTAGNDVKYMCVFGHNRHVEAITDPHSYNSEPADEECVLCRIKQQMLEQTHQEIYALQHQTVTRTHEGTSTTTDTHEATGATGTNEGNGVTGTNEGSNVTGTEEVNDVTGTNEGSGVTGTDEGSGITGTEEVSDVTGTDEGSGVTGTDEGSGVSGITTIENPTMVHLSDTGGQASLTSLPVQSSAAETDNNVQGKQELVTSDKEFERRNKEMKKELIGQNELIIKLTKKTEELTHLLLKKDQENKVSKAKLFEAEEDLNILRKEHKALQSLYEESKGVSQRLNEKVVELKIALAAEFWPDEENFRIKKQEVADLRSIAKIKDEKLQELFEDNDAKSKEINDLKKRLSNTETELNRTQKFLKKGLTGEQEISLSELAQKEEDLKKQDTIHEETIDRLRSELQAANKKIEQQQEKFDKFKALQDGNSDEEIIETVLVKKAEVEMTNIVLGKGAYKNSKKAVFRGTKVAAKQLYHLLLSDCKRSIIREANLSVIVRHPNIVQFIGAAVEGDNPILLYELMSTSLFTHLYDEVHLTHPQIIEAGCDIAAGLAYLHLHKPHPIIHRNISSSNILMDPLPGGRWRCKLSNLRVASNLKCHNKEAHPGHPAYAAPEAGDPDSHTPSMDVYSFGVLLMEMTLNTFPRSTHDDHLIQADSITGWDPMKELVHQCINKDLSKRPLINTVLESLRNNISI